MVDIPVPVSATAELPRVEVDEGTLAEVPRCDDSAIRKYVRAGILRRTSRGRYPFYESVGSVLEHLRQVASGHGSGDAMKAGAALKDAQRWLTETKLAKLEGQLISLPECEALWGDLAAAAKWLFLALPARLRKEDLLAPQAEERASMLCVTMLREVALSGQMQLPRAEKDADAQDDE